MEVSSASVNFTLPLKSAPERVSSSKINYSYLRKKKEASWPEVLVLG